MDIIRHHSLKQYNTFGLEAIANEFVEIHSGKEMKDFFSSHRSTPLNLFILGGGSNVLFTGDFQGTVFKICLSGIEVVGEDAAHVYIRVAAGEDWDRLVAWCVGQGLGGLENLSGIPGQVGSSPIQNIGAYGAELKDHFHSLDAINRCTGEKVTMDAGRCHFGYRDSIFKRGLKGRMVITHVTFRLDKRPSVNLGYHALKNHLAHIPEPEITLQQVRDSVLEIRASKLPDPRLTGNAGSFFKNPVVRALQLERLKEQFPDIVYFEVAPAGPQTQALEEGREGSAMKLAAGWLIEHCGWKGYREGDAGVHKDQALVLVNYGNATGLEILALSEKIRRSVQEEFGVELEREVNVI